MNTRKRPTLTELIEDNPDTRAGKGPLPKFLDLFSSTPLYRDFLIDPDDYRYFHVLKTGSFQFDCFCTGCRRMTPFKGTGPRMKEADEKDDVFKNEIFTVNAVCTRYGHVYSAIFRIFTDYANFPDSDDHFEKIGQTPSIEDIVGSEVTRFKPIFSAEDFAELKRATGLASHGIGIGSFVYLRRIFERLIEKHRKEHEQSSGPLADYYRMRMDERISALADVLPTSLVKNRATYSILSTGLHELDEETCRQYFPIIRTAIVRILEQDLKAEEEARADKELEDGIQAIKVRIGNKKSEP